MTTALRGRRPLIAFEGQDSVSSPRLDTVPTSSLGADSAARSQSSSFEESIASQSSTHQPTPSKVIRYSQQGSSLGTATPSTSLSNPSSQECPSNERQDTRHIPLSLPDEGEVNLRLRPASQEGHRQQLYGTDTRVLEAARNVLNKRMANGEVKINDPSLPTSPVDADRHSHSRDSSVTLKSNQISKVCVLPSSTRCMTM